jgi:hypothetical protein
MMIRLNRYLYLLILLCFFMPFAEGCHMFDASPEEKALMEKAAQDSIDAGLQNPDSLHESISQNPEPGIFTMDSTASEISRTEKIISAVLMPGGDYSGIFLAMIGWRSIEGLTSLFPAFIILIVLIFLSQRKKDDHSKSLFIWSVVFVVFMTMLLLYSSNDLMYGYWITLSLAIINAIIAFFNYQIQLKK